MRNSRSRILTGIANLAEDVWGYYEIRRPKPRHSIYLIIFVHTLISYYIPTYVLVIGRIHIIPWYYTESIYRNFF